MFGICLILMAVGVSGSMLFSGHYTMPELWNNLGNQHPDGLPAWAFMFVSIACGAISGFHATQAPMMSRCAKSEKEGQIVFYGAMTAEGIIALVWCAAGVTVFESTQALQAAGGGTSAVVYQICQSTMGKLGAILALVGVVICPISSGDTAYRSARLTLADWFRLDQSDWKKRLLLTLPLLTIGMIICHMDYSMVWRYFSWSNQTLAMIALWTAAVYLMRKQRNYWICALPAAFMTAVSMTYFVSAPECLGGLWKSLSLPFSTYYAVAVVVGIVAAVGLLAFFLVKARDARKNVLTDSCA